MNVETLISNEVRCIPELFGMHNVPTKAALWKDHSRSVAKGTDISARFTNDNLHFVISQNTQLHHVKLDIR